MKLLIITQKVDKEDSTLGFFHNWILALSPKFEKISVICLEKGSLDLPSNVKVYSLGKESGRSKIKYVKNFFNLILGLHRDYEAVFVHMNQEYVLLGGLVWKILRKKVYLWRNHPQGNIFTMIAVLLSNKVFCTSEFAFVARYKKTKIMPVGVDTDKFVVLESSKVHKIKNSILFLGRIAPIKRPDLLIEALNILDKKGFDFICDIYGDALPKDLDYFNSLKLKVKEFNLENKINFYKSVPNHETPKIYNEHEIFVNLTPSGSFDKTILEAAACGCLLVITNKSLEGCINDKIIITESPASIAEGIEFWLQAEKNVSENNSQKLVNYVINKHSLPALIERLYEQMSH